MEMEIVMAAGQKQLDLGQKQIKVLQEYRR